MMKRLVNNITQRYKKTGSTANGFTFVEIMIVILILGIITTIGFPSLSRALSDSRISRAVDEIVAAIQFAQVSAMTSGSKTRVTLDGVSDGIIIEKFGPDTDLLGEEGELSENDVEVESFRMMQIPGNPGIDYSLDLSDVDITSVAFGADNFVIFDQLGTPSTGGTVTIVSGSLSRIITINSLNGKITLSS